MSDFDSIQGLTIPSTWRGPLVVGWITMATWEVDLFVNNLVFLVWWEDLLHSKLPL